MEDIKIIKIVKPNNVGEKKRMKVAVITRHAISNYGSLLQTIATQKLIEQEGCECEIINYIRKDEEPKRIDRELLKLKPRWNGSFVKRCIYLCSRKPESIIAGKKFEKMRKEYLNLSRTYSSEEELQGDLPRADIYATGSDQVWGPMSNNDCDKSYFLSFVPEKNKKISIAASFGKQKFNSNTLEKMKKWLSSYSDITVREASTTILLDKMGIEAKSILDPTLMIPSSEWEKMCTERKKNKYVLVYQIHNNPKVNEYAKKISKGMNLRLERVSPVLHQFNRGGKFCYLPDLNKFLSKIKNADYIVTDSFHGTAFALNFNVPFTEILPENGTSSRNVEILELTGLTNRIVCGNEREVEIPYDLDFTNANKILTDKRKDSIQILKKILR